MCLPTDTLYGLSVDPFNVEAVHRVFAAKGRPADRATPLIAADMDQVSSQVGRLTSLGQALAGAFWPGPLTLIVPARPTLAAVADKASSVAVRVPAHPVARALCRAAGIPLTATSANRSGRAPVADATQLDAELTAGVDLLLDAGRAPGGPPSTIVDTTGDRLRLVRLGAVPWERVLDFEKRWT